MEKPYPTAARAHYGKEWTTMALKLGLVEPNKAANYRPLRVHKYDNFQIFMHNTDDPRTSKPNGFRND